MQIVINIKNNVRNAYFEKVIKGIFKNK